MATRLEIDLFYKQASLDKYFKQIEENARWIKYLKEQTPDLQSLLIKRNPLNLQYITEQTLHLIELALSKNIKSAKYIKWYQLTEEDKEYLRLKFEI